MSRDTSEHGHETPEYWEDIYAAGSIAAPVDPLLEEVVVSLSPGTALDVGCGEGQNSLDLAAEGWSVLGVDISSTAIERARNAGGDATFQVADARKWRPDREFDLVISTYALPPAGNGRDAVLGMAATVVAPGGAAYVAEFDESAQDLWSREDLVTVDELVGAFDGFSIQRAEVLTLPHAHGHDRTEWPVAVVVAQRSI